MPWLVDEVADWNALTDDEKNLFRAVVWDLGMCFPDDVDDDYYE